MIQQQLNQGIHSIFREVIKPKPHEKILIITCDDDNTFTVGKQFYDIAKEYTKHVSMIFHPEKGIEEYTEDAVLAALKSEPDIFLLTNMYKDGRDKYGEIFGYKWNNQQIQWYPLYLQLSKKSRGFFFMVNSVEQFAKAINTNYAEICSLSQKCAEELNAAIKVHIKDDHGTDLTIDISDTTRSAKSDFDGTQHLPGHGINIPFGEVLISPVMGKSTGVAYIDMEFYDEENRCTVMVDEPIKIIFDKGIIKTIEGGTSAARFQEIIDTAERSLHDQLKKGEITQEAYNEQMKNSRSISEFAIGVHRNVGDENNEPVADLLFDEKIYGTCHIAFGMSYDGDAAPYHSDFIFSRPEIILEYADGSKKIICKERKLFV